MSKGLYKSLVDQSLPLRRVVGKFIPDALSARARSAFGLRPVRTIDLQRLQLIQAASVEQLRNAEYLQTELLPAMGLSDEGQHVFPPSLHPCLGKGLRHWQYPIQLSKYLVHLSSCRVETYLEIGVQYGGTFAIMVEYLQRFRPLKAAYAVDTNRVPSLTRYAQKNHAVHVIRENSTSSRFPTFLRRRGPFDLVLIDGDHSKAVCRSDFEAVRPHARMIAFHDIVDEPCPGVRAVWREVKDQYRKDFNFYEFTEQYPEVQARLGYDSLGIGLAVRIGQ